MAEKTRYSDAELEEFRELIEEKLKVAQEDYDHTMDAVMNRDSNETDDTAPTYHALEEGSEVQSKEQLMAMAQRQLKFVQGLKAALSRDRKADSQGASACCAPCHPQHRGQEGPQPPRITRAHDR